MAHKSVDHADVFRMSLLVGSGKSISFALSGALDVVLFSRCPMVLVDDKGDRLLLAGEMSHRFVKEDVFRGDDGCPWLWL